MRRPGVRPSSAPPINPSTWAGCNSAWGTPTRKYLSWWRPGQFSGRWASPGGVGAGGSLRLAINPSYFVPVGSNYVDESGWPNSFRHIWSTPAAPSCFINQWRLMKVAARVVVLSPPEARPPPAKTLRCRKGRPPLDVPKRSWSDSLFLHPRPIRSTPTEKQWLTRYGPKSCWTQCRVWDLLRFLFWSNRAPSPLLLRLRHLQPR